MDTKQSAFKKKIYDLTKKIPRGKVATYGQLAVFAGSPKAARAVGMCMRTNPDAPQTPCHRVVSSQGKLTGYSANGGAQAEGRARLRAQRDRGGLSLKKQMLLDEGVQFIGDRVDLSVSQWQPHVSGDQEHVRE